ncbi:lytic murein transglycosylase B [Stutzerimonas stutzeri]|uniref:Lytic murein transglycosylase B n=1 Tax=Stutzerimonas stutzeri TaxID=316 RepID=A0A2S4AMJ4_STUST|nr:lytic murein transglycosylase B [Stutzerimonas stutzeri]MCQ4262779.1 lytic murein transglycosylase B [Stutzerimonas stutzeri]POH82703.1 lytic murein transglycosylase B [Stutzerimonas stutzeri]
MLGGVSLTGALLGSLPLQAADYTGPNVEEFIAEMTRDYGFVGDQLRDLFKQAERKQAILDAISRPAERVKPWKEYRPIFLTDSRVAQGVDFWRENETALARAETEYGVPPEIIVAIIGVETFYGRNTGSHRVIDALSTLGFDYPPRQPFFRQQLKEFLLLTREEQVDPLTLKGSYAGAMGLPQFMPSSFRAYAVDFDGDGRIDIWNNPTDAIGSAASYFKQHGWAAGEPVVARAKVSGERYEEGLTVGLESQKKAGEMRSLGWQFDKAVADDTAITAFRLEGAEGDEYWLGLPNFYVITRYNRSVMYAMAVHQLSQMLAEARGEQ